MEKKTGEMFVKTCQYLCFLLEDPTQLEVYMVPDAALTVNDLMVKLSRLISHLNRDVPVPETIVAHCSSDLNRLHITDSANMNNQTNSPLLRSVQNDAFPARMNEDLDKGVGYPQLREAGSPCVSPFNHCKTSVERIDFQSKNQVLGPSCSSISSCQTLPSHNGESVVNLTVKSDSPLFSGNVKPEELVEWEKQVKEKERMRTAYITKLFRNYIDVLLEGSIFPQDMKIYCRVCDELINELWSMHLEKDNHIIRSAKFKKLKMYLCYLCQICIFGSQDLILRYFEYHFLKIHKDKTEQNWKEVLVEVEPSDSNFKMCSSDSKLEHKLDNSAKLDNRKRIRKRKGGSKADYKSDSLSSISSLQSPDPLYSDNDCSLESKTKFPSNPPGIKTVVGIPGASPPFTKILNKNFPLTDDNGTSVSKSVDDAINFLPGPKSTLTDKQANTLPMVKTPSNVKKTDAKVPGNSSPSTKKTVKPKKNNKPTIKNSYADMPANALSSGNETISYMPDNIKKPAASKLANTPSTVKKAVANIPVNASPTKKAAAKQHYDLPIPKTPSVNMPGTGSSVSKEKKKISTTPNKVGASCDGQSNIKETVKVLEPLLDNLEISPYPEFDSLLKDALNKWRETTILPHMGYCNICHEGIRSAFAFMSHVMDHKELQSGSWTEEKCSRCNLNVFGEDHRKYFNFPIHLEICKIIKS